MTDFALDVGLIELEFRTHARRNEVGPASTGMLGLGLKVERRRGEQAADGQSNHASER